MGHYLSAFRAKDKFLNFIPGEAIYLTKSPNEICGPYGIGKSSLLSALFSALCGDASPLDVNYAPMVDGDCAQGVLYVDFFTLTVKTFGSAQAYQEELQTIANSSDRIGILRFIREKVDNCIVILDEPYTFLHNMQVITPYQLSVGTRYYQSKGDKHRQMIIAHADPFTPWSPVISVGNKCWASSKHLRCARKLERLTTPINKNVNGFVVRVDRNCFYQLARQGGPQDRYLFFEGKSSLNSNPTCAYIYGTRTAAENAIDAITSVTAYSRTAVRVSYQDSLTYFDGVKHTGRDKFEILTVTEHMENIFNIKAD